MSRLSQQDADYYSLESTNTPMHVGTLAIIEQGPLDYESLVRLVDRRLARAPRYRKRVREVPFGLARPVWIDDPDFDITYHVRWSALPRPGSEDQLRELIGRLISRPLDRTRPLWELYLVEGLEGDRAALFVKADAALVDSDDANDLAQFLFEDSPEPQEDPEDLWMPHTAPGDLGLIADAVGSMLLRPGDGLSAVRAVASRVTRAAIESGGALEVLARSASQSAPVSPLNAPVSRNRRLALVKTSLADYRAVRARYDCDVNDVILAVVAGAMRYWLLSRGEPITESTTVRALVPMTVYLDEPTEPDESVHHHPPARVSTFLVDLPVGEPNPVMRLSHIAHAGEGYSPQGRLVAAKEMTRIVGFGPATLHTWGARVASTFSQRMFNLVVTNAPGPQVPLYAAGARVIDMYPVAPLLRSHVLSMAVTSYDGHVYYGLNADREAMGDVDVVASLLLEALDELREAKR